MSPQQFKAWRTRHGWSQTEAGLRIGLSRRQIANFEDGSIAVSKTVELACATASLGIEAYDGCSTITFETG